MKPYSTDDSAESSDDRDTLRADGPIDSYGRDVDDYARAVDYDSPNEYAHTLMLAVDSRHAPSTKRASAHAHTVSAFAFDIVASVSREYQRDAFMRASRRLAIPHSDRLTRD